jgi:polysaccharide export outer membrane protein
MKAFIRFTLLCAAIFAAAADATSQDSGAPATPSASTQTQTVPVSFGRDERYRIGFQDQLEIQVFRHPELTQRVGVNSNGTVNLFRLNKPITAVCKTERELANDIAAAYEKDYLRNPEVNVVAVEQRSRAFAVIGAVEKPGTYFINRKVRLLELLAQAGGPNKEAGTRILVARTGSTSSCKLNDEAAAGGDEIALLDYKLKDVMEAKQDLVMRPGDIVSVMDADVVYVYGNVNKQGQVEIKEPLTLTQALASAEGIKSATSKKVRVLRQRPGSMERDEFIYDLGEIASRKAADPFLEPNDVVAVSQDKVKSILNSIGKSLTGGIPSILYRVP